jgi:hypothetical protein
VIFWKRANLRDRLADPARMSDGRGSRHGISASELSRMPPFDVGSCKSAGHARRSLHASMSSPSGGKRCTVCCRSARERYW